MGDELNASPSRLLSAKGDSGARPPRATNRFFDVIETLFSHGLVVDELLAGYQIV
jgi:hypothetical protein